MRFGAGLKGYALTHRFQGLRPALERAKIITEALVRLISGARSRD